MRNAPVLYDAYGVALERKASRTGALIYLQKLGQPSFSGRDYSGFAKEGYQQNPIANRCIRLLSEAVASLPWAVEIKAKKKTDKTELIFEHPVLALLDRPNPLQTRIEFLTSVDAFLNIAGQSFVEYNERDEELFSLRADRMKLVGNDRGYPEAYEYKAGGQTVRWEMATGTDAQQPILHMRMFNPLDDSYGQSPIEAASRSVDIFNAASAYQLALLQNEARPSGALIYQGPDDDPTASMPSDKYDRLKKEISEVYSGPQNAGRPMVLDGGLKWIQMGQTMADLGFIEGKRESAREVALGFGVPPMLLGLPGDNTYANYAEANRAFYRQAVLPQADLIRHALTHFLRPTFGDAWTLAYDIDEISALEPEREARWKKIAGANWITNDEAREATGYAPATDQEWGASPKIAGNRGQGDRGGDRGERESRDLGKTDAKA